MTVEQEIKFAKNEKRLNESANAMISELNFNECNDLAAALNLKYSEQAEVLNNYNFQEAIANYVGKRSFSLEEAMLLGSILGEELNETQLYEACKKANQKVEAAKKAINENRDLKESYELLSKLHIFFESPNIPGKAFLGAYKDGGSSLDAYLKKNAKRYEKKGLSPEEAEAKATENYEKRAEALRINTTKNK